MRIEPELSAASVVLIGSFNPKIFQPFWMAKHGLISEKAAEAAEISVIHSEISAFSIDGLFSIQVDRNRFAIERKIAPLILVSDTVVRLFSELLPHTPVQKMGINRFVHFNVGSFDERDRIGMTLAPQQPWGEWGKKLSSGEGAKHGGMLSLAVVQKDVPDRPGGWVQAKIEPSTRVGGGLTGIYMEVNDHYEITDESEKSTPLAMMKILSEKWDKSIQNSENIIDGIMSLKK
jgi:hypothetical protein